MMLTTRRFFHQSSIRSHRNAFYRYLSTSIENDDVKKEKQAQKLPSFADASLRGVGQVVFCNSPLSGAALLGGLTIGDPYLAGLAAMGTLSATGTAHIAGLDKDAFKNGLHGYNGCLVGCASAVFIAPESIVTGVTTTLLLGAATPFVAASLKPAMGSIPQWTLSFNIVTLSMLLQLKPLNGDPPLIEPLKESFVGMYMDASLKGVSEIFVVDSSLAGAAMLGGMAVYSPGLAAHTFMGASMGALTGLALGADMTEVGMGLWGFNSALTSLAVGVFFVPTYGSVALSAGGAAATAVVFGALKTVFGAGASPCLTLPFCITMTGCYLLHGSTPSLQLAKDPHSPEKNEA